MRDMQKKKKKVNTRIIKTRLDQHTCVNALTHSAFLSLSLLPVLNFQLNSLLGDSLPGFHTPKVSGEIHQTVPSYTHTLKSLCLLNLLNSILNLDRLSPRAGCKGQRRFLYCDLDLMS